MRPRKPQSGLRRSTHLPTALALLGFAALPLTWIPVFEGFGLLIEVSNAAALVAMLVLPFALARWRGTASLHAAFGMMLLWSWFFAFSMAANGTTNGFPILYQQIPQVLFGWTLALAIANSDISPRKIGMAVTLSTLLVFQISTIVAGIDFWGAVVSYISGGPRDALVYGTIRPAFNAFTSSTDVNYVASQINGLANALVLGVVLTTLSTEKNSGTRGRWADRAALLSAAVALVLVLILFSTSASLAIALFAIALLARVVHSAPAIWRLFVPLVVLFALMFAYGPMSGYVKSNLIDDVDSRSARTSQYAESARIINDHLFNGVGYFEVDGHPVHNWLLFSWSTSGAVAAFIVLVIYGTVFVTFLKLISSSRLNWAAVIGLLSIFVIRTNVGGAGGIPSGAAIGAMAGLLGLAARGRREHRFPAADRLARRASLASGILPEDHGAEDGVSVPSRRSERTSTEPTAITCKPAATASAMLAPTRS